MEGGVRLTENVLKQFLVEAKRSTYAALGDDATVRALLPGSKQLEYRQSEFLYRDVYVGMFYFVGQEIVYRRDVPVWSMSYGGGLAPDVSTEQRQNIYAFLRQALRQVPSDRPCRGPNSFEQGEFSYRNDCSGTIERFHGVERITAAAVPVYELRYAGGVLA
jgi:hypothetical protein